MNQEYSPKPGTKAAIVFAVLKSADKPLSMEEIRGKTTGLSLQETKGVVHGHFMNPIHNSALQRAGLAIKAKDDKYKMIKVAANPNARRERGGRTAKPGIVQRHKAPAIPFSTVPMSGSSAKTEKKKSARKPDPNPAPRGKSIAEALAAKIRRSGSPT